MGSLMVRAELVELMRAVHGLFGPFLQLSVNTHRLVVVSHMTFERRANRVAVNGCELVLEMKEIPELYAGVGDRQLDSPGGGSLNGIVPVFWI